MPASTIYVNSNGQPYSGARVQLSFLTGGITEVKTTDSEGKATISHSATGNAKVIVNGATKLTFRAPSTIAIEK